MRAGPWIDAQDTFAPESPPPKPSAMHVWIHDIACGSEAGSYLRLIDFLYHSTLGLGVIKKKKNDPRYRLTAHARPQVALSEPDDSLALNTIVDLLTFGVILTFWREKSEACAEMTVISSPRVQGGVHPAV